MTAKPKILAAMAVLTLLAGCASPAAKMTDAQIRHLSDDQLCSLQNSYRGESRTEAEIAGRGLNCDRFHRQCLKQGNQPGTQAMAFCEATLRENERLSYERPYADDDFGLFHRHHRRGSGLGIGVGF